MHACAVAFVAVSKALSFHSSRALSRRIPWKRPNSHLFSSVSRNKPVAYNKNYRDTDINLMNHILYRVRAVNHMPADVRSGLVEFHVDGVCVGKVDPLIANLVCSIDTVFTQNQDGILTLTPDAGTTFDSRTRAVARVMEKMRDDGVVTGWRDEEYPVSTGFYNEPYFVIERAATSLLGILEYVRSLVSKKSLRCTFQPNNAGFHSRACTSTVSSKVTTVHLPVCG